DDGFETADVDPRIVGQPCRGAGPFLDLTQSAVILQRVTGRHQPPYAVELQPLDRKPADRAMRFMWRVERAAEQTDPHAGAVKRDWTSRGQRGGGRLLQTGHRDCPTFTAASARCREPGI